MNALDELEEIKELVNNDKKFKYKSIVNFNCENIEKPLKSFEIIKEKDVDIYILRKCKTVDEYNFKIVHIVGETRELTEEEFDLLKEVLE